MTETVESIRPDFNQNRPELLVAKDFSTLRCPLEG